MNLENAEESAEFSFIDVFKAVFDVIYSSVSTQINRILALSICATLLQGFRNLKARFVSNDTNDEIDGEGKNDKRDKRETAEEAVFLAFFISWGVVITYAFMLATKCNFSIETLKSINKEELVRVIWECFMMIFSVSSLVSGFLLPSRIVTIILFAGVALLLIYLIFGSSMISAKYKFLASGMVVLGSLFGYSYGNEAVENYVKKIQTSIKCLVANNRTVIPVLLSASFTISIQTLIITFILKNTPFKSVVTIPILLLSDWTYNVIYGAITVFIASFFYQSNYKNEKSKAELRKKSIEIIKDEILNIVVNAFALSFLGTLFKINTAISFVLDEEGYFVKLIESWKPAIGLSFDLAILKNECILYERAIAPLKAENEQIEIKEALEDTKDVNKAENILLYVAGYKDLAIRIPILIISFFMIIDLPMSSVLKITSAPHYIEAPIKMFEAMFQNPSLANVIGITVYLALIFYLLSIPMIYFTNKIYESRRVQKIDIEGNVTFVKENEKKPETIRDRAMNVLNWASKFFKSS